MSRETGESHRVMQSITAMDVGALNIGIEVQNASPLLK